MKLGYQIEYFNDKEHVDPKDSTSTSCYKLSYCKL